MSDRYCVPTSLPCLLRVMGLCLAQKASRRVVYGHALGS
uniref:Uncharacterized protein n=1 Tax=Arundo donax TaxID=35708 RepID=A0A0A9DSQ6_ARUDO